MTKPWTLEDPIPFLWQQREQLKPLYDRYGARVLGKALAEQFALATSRTACHKLAAFFYRPDRLPGMVRLSGLLRLLRCRGTSGHDVPPGVAST